MNIDFEAVRSGQVSLADLIRDIKHSDLYTMMDELFNALEAILAKATDASVLFVPHDAAATDQNEQGWSLSHIIAHLTATLEGAATASAIIARGIEIKERLRYETPWESLSTRQLVQARIKESHRICRAFLDAWPDEPNLDITVTLVPRLGPLNAIGLYTLGIAHAQGHLGQLRDTLRQAIS